MDKLLLSMKTIYKMLMSNDFPIYSDSVIPEKVRKGQTLLRFWQSMILEEFRTQPYGRQIWRNDGKRNRYLSNLCNRSADLKLYSEYAREIMSQLTAEAMLDQIDRFSEFLTTREYRHDILLRRGREVLRLWEAEDNRITERIQRHIRSVLDASEQMERYGISGSLFQAGYLLTLMSLYAMAGEAMADPVTMVLGEEAYSLTALWNLRRETTETKKHTVDFLTSRWSSLLDNPLPRQRFFGREEALYDIREMAMTGRKCLISGIGGIGKTELLRQLLRLCQEERIADKIAVVPYMTGLAESMLRAFGDHAAGRPEEAFRRILFKLRQEAESGTKLLVLLDDLNQSSQEDPELLELQHFPCGILVTSRRKYLEGFDTYELNAPDVTAGALIFRDNYGQPLRREDRTRLMEMLREGESCHPLTLNLMARAAKGQNWSVSQLQEHLHSEGKDLTWVEDDRVIQTGRIFRQLYSLLGVPESAKQIAELFTLLPSGSYTLDRLLEVFPEILGEEAEEKLAQLAEGGWLEQSGSGYAMHPLIAESLRRRVLTEARQTMLLQCIRRRLPPLELVRNEMEPLDENSRQTGGMLLYLSKFLSGSISRELLLDQLRAASIQLLTQTAKEDLAKCLCAWYKRCREGDDLTELIFWSVLSSWNKGEAEPCRRIFESQMQQLSVPQPLFLDFCLCAGMDMIYKQEPQLAEEMLKKVLEGEASADQKAMAYYNLSGCSHLLGSSEDALQWSEAGARFVREHPQCSKLTQFNNLHMLCNMYLKYRKQLQAQEVLQELGVLMEGNTQPDLQGQYYSVLGLYEMAFGDPDKALHYMQRQQELYEECFGRDRDYYLTTSMIAQTQMLQKRFEESAATYLSVIAYAEQIGDKRLLQSASNNISVTYMKNDQPEKARIHLETAVSEGRQIGGLMLGEALRNSAICYGMLGDREQELAFFLQAEPLLLEAYGEDHPRYAVVRQRLEELKRET